MSCLRSRLLQLPRTNVLPACIASILALAAPTAAFATNRPVTSCLDDFSPGTLRSVINAPTTVSGDTVDLSALSCPSSKITLATNGTHIQVTQGSLNIKGPAAGTLTIDGSALEEGMYYNSSNVFFHTGAGTLAVRYLSITGGHEKSYHADSQGGCIYSASNVVLFHAHVSSCSASSTAFTGKGGGVYAKGSVTLSASTVTGNTAMGGSGASGGGVWANGNVNILGGVVSSNSISTGFGDSHGGGIFASGYVYLTDASTLSGNSASANIGNAFGGGAEVGGDFFSSYSTTSGNQVSAGSSAYGGGLLLQGNVVIANSTISGNTSDGTFGGIRVSSMTPGSNTFAMRNSTISGNSAASGYGGLSVNSGTTKFFNSTIAFNTSGSGAPGVVLDASLAPMGVTLQSTLMSNNSYGSTENDLVTVNSPNISFNSGPANNLIRITGAGGLPGDTKFITCPSLGPLRDNGGLTKTHALLSTSIAIDSGNNVLIDPNTMSPYANDQRGSLANNGTRNYVRVSGTQADIGAYEVQKDDIVFNAGFEGCP